MYEVTMPKLSDSMEQGKIIEWKVSEGDAVNEGDVLAEVESDKATMELECFHEGVVSRIVHGDGEEVPVGEVIAFIGEAGEEAPEAEEETPPKTEPETEDEPETAAEPEPAAAAEAPATPPAEPSGGDRIAISPYARKLAEQRDIDYHGLEGSGPGGRIVARDIEEATGEAKPETKAPEKRKPAETKDRGRAGVTIEPMAATLARRYSIDPGALTGTGLNGRVTVDDVKQARGDQAHAGAAPSPDEELPPIEVADEDADITDAPFRMKTIARRVIASQHAIPHFYITRGVEVSALLKRREALKQEMGATVTHLLALACVRALKEHPEVNRTYDHGRVIAWKHINLGLAIDTDEGLTVAVLRRAEGLSLAEIVRQADALVERARSGKLSADERRHAGFTITNLGMFDVEHFEPIINPPS